MKYTLKVASLARHRGFVALSLLMKNRFYEIDPCSQYEYYTSFFSLLAKRQNKLDCFLHANLFNSLIFVSKYRAYQCGVQ